MHLTIRNDLIEVALPLEVINEASAPMQPQKTGRVSR